MSLSVFDLIETEQADYFDAIRGVKAAIEATDLKDLYLNMLSRDDLKDRPKDHIETVLKLDFLGNKARCIHHWQQRWKRSRKKH
jgi:hypothetical protein